MRYQRTLGLDAEQLEELHARVEDILAEPWDKGTGRPKKLTLREAIMVTLMYKRQNIPEEVIGDISGVSQSVVSNVITMLTPLIADATEEFRPGTEEAMQVTRGRLALVDGTTGHAGPGSPHGSYGRGNTARPAMADSLSAMNTATLSS